MKLILKLLTVSILAMGVFTWFTACNDTTEEDIFPIGGIHPEPIKFYLEDEDGVNLLSSVEGNWLYAPFSITMRDYTTNICWEKFTLEHSGGYFGPVKQTKKWDGTKLVPVPDSYYIEFGNFFFDRNEISDIIIFHFQPLNRDFTIKFEWPYDEKNKQDDYRILVDGEVAATNSEEIHLVVPRRISTPESNLQ